MNQQKFLASSEEEEEEEEEVKRIISCLISRPYRDKVIWV